ncbi:hypothetical protein ABZP36_006691 [Zizania latifolia]
MAAAATARWLVLLLAISAAAWAPAAAWDRRRQSGGAGAGHVVEKERRRVVAASDGGLVTAVDVADAAGSAYRLHFITTNPGALFLPVQLHADMVFYVHSGRGKVTCIKEGNSESESLQVERGDVYSFEQGTILYIQSYPLRHHEKSPPDLRHLHQRRHQRRRPKGNVTSAYIINSLCMHDSQLRPTSEAYSDVSDLLKGFDVEVLRLGFGVPRKVVEAIKSTRSPPAIIPYNPEEEDDDDDDERGGVGTPSSNKKDKQHKHKGKDKDRKSKSKAFNIFSGKPDVENRYGWGRSMTDKDIETLQGFNIGMFMVNLTTASDTGIFCSLLGAMMGPHWNPKATEFATVTKGVGMVQTVCPSIPSRESKRRRRGEGGGGDDHGGVGCRNTVFRVKEGDVFMVPWFHPMAQISFSNEPFVFVGFSTDVGRNHPQFLAGKQSALQLIGKEILALSLGQANSTAVERLLLSAQRESTIMACTCCAEQLEREAEQEQEEGRGKGEGRERAGVKRRGNEKRGGRRRSMRVEEETSLGKKRKATGESHSIALSGKLEETPPCYHGRRPHQTSGGPEQVSTEQSHLWTLRAHGVSAYKQWWPSSCIPAE